MIEVRALFNHEGQEFAELRFPVGTPERTWEDACTAYEGFSNMQHKAFEGQNGDDQD